MDRQAVTQNEAPLLRASSIAASLALGIAALALVGWASGIPILTNVFPDEPAMNPFTSIGVIAAALAILSMRRRESRGPLRAFAFACAGLATAIGAMRLLGITFAIAPDLDQTLFHARLVSATFPSRMGFHSALALVCIGAALLTLDLRARRGWRVSDLLLYSGLTISIVSLIGYCYRAAPMRGVMAMNSACAIFLLCVSACLARPERGLCGLLRSASAGGVMARRLLPAAIVIPFVLAWLRLEGQHAGMYGLEFGTAMLAVAIVALLTGLISMTGRSLDAAERERNRAESALKKSLEHQGRLLEANLIGVLTANVDGWITEANAAFLGMIGYTREALPLRSEWITPPEWRGRTDAAVRELADHGVATPFEKEYVHRDGHRVSVLVGAAVLPGSGGEVMAFVVDLSGKKEAEREMERLRQFLDSVIENLPNMVFVKEASELRFVRFNRAGEELLGLRREDLLGKNDHDFFPKEQAEFFIDKDRAVLTTGELLDIAEEEIRTASGETRILHTKKVPIVDEQGTPRYLLGISEDITDRKRAERDLAELNEGLRRRSAELEAVNHELEAFSYSVSHDLRAPLRHIDGFADLLVRHSGAKMDEKGRRHLQTISDSAKNMGELIDDLLALSRMSRTEMRRDSVDLNALVSEVRRSLEDDTAGRRIRWEIAPLPDVQGDRGMLRLVLVNLLANAVKYSRTREEAVIEVGSRETEDEVVVFVRDNGVGFDMKYAHKLFGVFQRLHSDEQFEGTGIGLASVRRVIQRHGGRTWAEGETDVGATLSFALPREAMFVEFKEAG